MWGVWERVWGCVGWCVGEGICGCVPWGRGVWERDV